MAKRGAKKQPAKTKAEQRAAMLEQILDAAELLFSKHGLNGVTLRDVARKIGVHTSLMHYYFVDKRQLFEAVFARRASITSDRRMQALERYERAAGKEPTVEGALHAFLDTDLELYRSGGPGWKNFAAFVAQVSNSKEGAAMMDLHFDRVVLKLIGILKKALPECDEKDVFWGYDFLTGAFLHTLGNTGRIDRLSSGACQSDDLEAVQERMTIFMTAGFLALCKSGRKAARVGKRRRT